MYVISNVHDDYASCVNEQDFKRLYCADRKKVLGHNAKLFCIETEETIAGFPDVMEVITLSAGSTSQVFFFEFKISDRSGSIKFQPTQPAFYKQNHELPIKVVAYNRVSRRVHVFKTQAIFCKDTPYYTTNGRINLSKIEKELGI
jgi:hypothetical protein